MLVFHSKRLILRNVEGCVLLYYFSARSMVSSEFLYTANTTFVLKFVCIYWRMMLAYRMPVKSKSTSRLRKIK
jgi:hypothetical protein